MNPIVVALVVSFAISSAKEVSYPVQLPFKDGYVPTTAKVTFDDEKRLITVEIENVEGKSLGGITHFDFGNKLFILTPTDGSRCNIFHFPSTTYEKAKTILTKAPGNEGKLRGVYCISKNIPAPYEGISDEAKKLCNLDSGKFYANDVSNCSVSDANARDAYRFSIVAGVVVLVDAEYGIFAIVGGRAD